MANNLNRVIEHEKEKHGIVPFDQQTPEQRREFVSRIRILNLSLINLAIIQENWAYVCASIPDKKSSPIYHSKFKQTKKALVEYMDAAKMFHAKTMNLMAASNEAKDSIEAYSWYNKEIIDILLSIPEERLEEAISTLKSLSLKQ